MSRFTINPKKVSLEDLTVILLCAGNNLLERQLIEQNLRCIFSVDAGTDVILVINRDFPFSIADSYNVRLVENENFIETGPARSALIGMRVSLKNNILIAYGDTKLTPKHLTNKASHVTLGKAKTKVGAVITDGMVTNMAYNLENKWGQTLLLRGKEVIDNFKSKYRSNLLFHEIINECIEEGLRLEIVRV